MGVIGVVFMADKKSDRKELFQKIYAFSAVGVIVIFLLYVGIEAANIPDNDDPSYYDTGDFRDMNEEEFKDYLEWKEKQYKNND